MDNNITVVQYPSNHIPEYGPKILIVGDHVWRENMVNYFKMFWTDNHLNIYHVPEDIDLHDGDNMSDIITWLCMQYSICDLMVGNIRPGCSLNHFVFSSLGDEKTFITECRDLDYGDKVLTSFFSRNNLSSIDASDVIKIMQNFYNLAKT